MTIFEIITIVISLISLIVSIIAIIITFRKFNQDLIIQNRTQDYGAIIQEYIVNKFPKVYFRYLDIRKGTINNDCSQEFEELISRMRDEFKIIQIESEKAFLQIDSLLIELDEKVIILSQRNENNIARINELKSIVRKLHIVIRRFRLNSK